MASLVLLVSEFLHPHKILDSIAHTSSASTAVVAATVTSTAAKINEDLGRRATATAAWRERDDVVDAAVEEEEDLPTWIVQDLVWP